MTNTRRPHQLAQALAAVLAVQAASAGAFGQAGDGKAAATVDLSAECASFLVLGSGAVSGLAMGALTQAALPLLSSSWCGLSGFCSAGVSSGSLASWWQSTMPLVAKGSVFATLQSIAMSSTAGAGATAGSVLIGGYLGGATSAAYITDICRIVDEAAAEGTATSRGAAVTLVHSGVQASISTGSYVSQQAAHALEAAAPHYESAKEYVKDNLPHAVKAAEEGLAGAWTFLVDTYTTAHNTVREIAEEVAEDIERDRLARERRERIEYFAKRRAARTEL